MGSERLRLKIGGAILGVVVLALLVTTTLSYLVYERILSGLLISRFALVANELRAEIEASLDLGLPLGELDNVQQLLAKRRSTDDQIVGITIFDGKGVILFDTERREAGARVAAGWLVGSETATGQAQDALTIEPFTVGTSLVNSFGKLTGGIIIRYSSTYLHAKLDSMILRLGEVVGLVLALSACIALAGVLVLTERLAYVYTRLETSVRVMLRRIGHPIEEEGLPRELQASFLVLERDLHDTITRLATAVPAPASGERVGPA